VHDGWYVSREGSPYGPYTWERMVEFVREGSVSASDLVHHESWNDWRAAETVQGLIVTPQPTPEPAPLPQYATAAVPQRKKRWSLIVGVILAALVLAGGCFAAFLIFSDGDSGGDESVATYTKPAADSIVQSAELGPVPANQIGVTLAEDGTRANVERLAETLGGTITGELGFMDLFIIETDGTTEADLLDDLETAAAAEGIEFAAPNQVTYRDIRFEGVRVTTMDDPVYEDGRDRPQRIIGASRAADIIRASGLDLNAVKVGITDDGLYTSSEIDGDVNFVTADEGDALSVPDKIDGVDDPAYSHGTAVASVIGANDTDGGMAGIAAPLGDKLTISMTNIWGPKYGVNAIVPPDPTDPTQGTFSDGTFALGNLVALKQLVDEGNQVINCSWGNSNAHPHTASIYKRFFEKMNQEHPGVLFVCSAGNNGSALNGEHRYPSGLSLPNMITVGNLENDGTTRDSSNRSSANFEVTLAAPGNSIVHGVALDGTVVNDFGGTSMASPQVASTAAMLLALDPTLSAADLKRIISETARLGVLAQDGQTSTPISDEVGGRILAVDQAVLKVVNDLRAKNGLPPLTDEDITGSTTIDLYAESGEEGMWNVAATFPKVASGGADIELTYQGEGMIGGLTSQRLTGDGSIEWSAQLLDDSMVIFVTRSDSGAKWRVAIRTLAGTYEGTISLRLGSASQTFEYESPLTITVGADGSVTGEFGWSGVPSISQLDYYSESGTFSGTVDKDGNLTASGSATGRVTWYDGDTSSKTDDFTLDGTICDGEFVGTLHAAIEAPTRAARVD